MARGVNKSAAVVQQRAAALQEADDPVRARDRKLDFFPTPPWAARAGAEILKEIDPYARSVWEPACGEGHIAKPIEPYFDKIYATDIHDHGHGDVADFLLWQPGALINGIDPFTPGFDWVFTNPPFMHAEAFLKKGLQVARRGVALLLRIAFLEGIKRYETLYGGPYPLTGCAPFSERVSMVLGEWDPEANQAMCFAWFFFQKGAKPMPIRPIPPGTQARLTLPDDVHRFAKAAPIPLFEGLASPPDSSQP